MRLCALFFDPSRPLEGEVVLRAHHRTGLRFAVLRTALVRLAEYAKKEPDNLLVWLLSG